MLALRKIEAAPGLSLEEVPEPVPGEGEVLVQVKAAGICGSDLHVKDWAPAYAFIEAAVPVTLGHEFSGQVTALGKGVNDLEVGDRVTVMPSVTCGRCEGCRSIGPDGCIDRKGIGMTRDGAFAAMVAAPAINCVKLPEGLSYELAALTEPLSVSAEAVSRGAIGAGAKCLVIGPGTIGQGIALLARRAGADVVVSGLADEARFAVLRELGFSSLVDMSGPDGARRLTELAPGGFDCVFEAAGSRAAVEQGLRSLRMGGTLVVAGIYDEPMPMDLTYMVRRSLTLAASYRSPRKRWPEIVAMLAREPQSFRPMISHRCPLSSALEGFDLALRRVASKVMLVPEDPAR